ncbi:F-box/LRR-repeat protein At2g42730-like [Malania oleifera]|uniref:F-box/LRR-repeat protein At2g42730-like n=1 Tax=Malania oleifera TaxID=397392 RepID=UPI0025AE516F|nr:F-box/LRR-repeat protein At2g42730-like [Malania oleifera]
MTQPESYIRKVMWRNSACPRISRLPDSVLSHILSFVPTTDAVKTGVLSTRWKHLFASASNVHFDDSRVVCDFLNRRGKRRKTDLVPLHSFVIFVYRVLALRNSQLINRFRFKCAAGQFLGYEMKPHLNTWISVALWHGVRELDLHISPLTKSNLLPCRLFTSATLRVLKLTMNGAELNVPASVRFSSLKILHLRSMVFVDDGSVKRLFSGCSVLEDLLIEFCNFNRMKVVDISIPTLLMLTINGRTSNYENNQNIIPQPLEDSSQFCLPQFPHLTYLELDSAYASEWKVVSTFIENSPHLEELIFPHYFTRTSSWPAGSQSPTTLQNKGQKCLSSMLRKIEIRKFSGSEYEFKLIGYFLKISEGLEMLTIIKSWTYDLKSSFDISKKLLMLPRRYKTCQIELNGL